MKVCILTMVWRRPAVFKVFAMGVHRLQTHFPEIDFVTVAVGSEAQRSKNMVEKEGFIYHEFPNIPLTAKAQHHLEKAKETNADAYLFLGSDNFITPAYFAYVLHQYYEGADYIAPYDIYYTRKHCLYYSPGYKHDSPRHGEPLAPGRLVESSVLDRCNWHLWDEPRKKGLDYIVHQKLKKKCRNPHFFYCRDIGGMLVDCKSNVNLSKWRADLEANIITDRLQFVLPNDIARQIQSF